MIQPIGYSRKFVADGVGWEVFRDLRFQMFDANGFRLDHWKSTGQATVVKSGSGRTIYNVRLPDAHFYIKHFQAKTFGSFLHYSIREGRASRECHLAQFLMRCGINTIHPIALGERRRRGMLYESFLVTEAIPNGMTLFDLIERGDSAGNATRDQRLREHIAQELAKLIATIHQQGVEHRDLHERNIVIQPRDDREFNFFLLDLHELRVHKELPWASAVRELTRMGRYFTLRTSRADRLRFFKHYCRFRDLPKEKFRELALAVEAATDNSRADFWRRRDTRSAHKNPRINEYRSFGVRAFAQQDIPESVVRDLMADPDRPFDNPVIHWWKQGRGTRVAELQMPSIRPDASLIYKQHYFKGWHESFAALFHYNQANRAWYNGASLLLREIPTPKPLILIEKQIGGMPVTSYLVTERVPEGQPISQFLESRMPTLTQPERRQLLRELMRQAANLLRMMHDRRVTHNDLKASNILVQPGDHPTRPRLCLIDLDSVQTWQNVPPRRRLQNLTRFYVSFHHSRWISLTDRVRFLRLYYRSQFHRSDRWKDAWRVIEAGAKQKIERNLRQGRSVL